MVGCCSCARSLCSRRSRCRQSQRNSDAIGDHPLWAKALEVARDPAVPEWWLQEAVLDQHRLRCFSACMIVVTTNKRIVYQNRREGRQGFGGGRYLHSLVNKCHSARRELFMESNLDLRSQAIRSVSSPFLVSQASEPDSSWAWFGTCWVQIVLVDDNLVLCDTHGVVWVDETQLWSRELGGRGQFYCGRPIFEVTTLDFDQLHTWRRCDRICLLLLKKEIEAAQQFRRTPATAYFDWSGNHGLSVSDALNYERDCRVCMQHWEAFFGDIAVQRWPLIATPVLYATMVDPVWRHRELLRVMSWHQVGYAQAWCL